MTLPVDDLLYRGVSPHVEWRRTSTLAESCDRCDFRYLRHA